MRKTAAIASSLQRASGESSVRAPDVSRHVALGDSMVRALGDSKVRALGARAHAALVRSRGVTRAVPGFESTGFRFAGDELVWAGFDAPSHPRAVLLASGTLQDRYHLGAAIVHAPRMLTQFISDKVDARNAASMAVLRLVNGCAPRGFATLLKGILPAFPLSHRADAARALATACAADDAASFAEAAARLLGVGSGLTPSGDDFAGGALFARRLVGMNRGWQRATDDLVALAPSRSHEISATLLADLAAGESYTALHDLAESIASGGDVPAIEARMQVLTRIGHSSGWDMLAGFIAGLTGQIDFSRN